MNLTSRVVAPLQRKDLTAAQTCEVAHDEDDARWFRDGCDNSLGFCICIAACRLHRLVLRGDSRARSGVAPLKNLTANRFLKNQMRKRFDSSECAVTHLLVPLCDTAKHPIYVVRSDCREFLAPDARKDMTRAGVISTQRVPSYAVCVLLQELTDEHRDRHAAFEFDRALIGGLVDAAHEFLKLREDSLIGRVLAHRGELRHLALSVEVIANEPALPDPFQFTALFAHSVPPT